MTFSEPQVRRLKAKLDAKRVKLRQIGGLDVSYVEGWYVMAEANRIFGFDGWDRLSHSHQLLYERREAEVTHVAYFVRVRVSVRAGSRTVVREGSGFGSAIKADAGEAHEFAFKAAETDGTKRALATFGNRFGLALYDKEHTGVSKLRSPSPGVSAHTATPAAPTTNDSKSDHTRDQSHEGDAIQNALIFLKATKERLGRAISVAEVDDILTHVSSELQHVRDARPDLRNRRGVHLADVVASIANLRRQEFERQSGNSPIRQHLGPLRVPIDKSRLALATPKRYRDKDHLKRLAALPCLVCGRSPSHAHHLRFAQHRGLALKVSDEFTVPLCAIDHDALHRAGDERRWWTEKKIDPLLHAEALWRSSRGLETASPIGPARDADTADNQ